MSQTANPLPAYPQPTPNFQEPSHMADGGLSEAARLVDTFVAPSKTFTDIRRSSRWWLPFLISVLISYAFVYTIEHKIGWSQVVENTLRQSPKQQERFADMESTQASQARKQMAAGFRYFAFGAPLFSLLVAAVAASVLLATINFGFGGEATFGRMFAVWMYGTLPMSLKAIFAIGVLYAGLSPELFNMENPAGTNLGYYLSSDLHRGLVTLASSLDVLTIWSVVLLIIGCSIVGKVKRSSAAVAVIGWWVLTVLASTAAAVVRS